ncbi:Alpha/Beta hydrolase protein [Aspergillus bertholletiae]|uniref:Alpha/Beta hydrolase protein n=1 Tax=Aspergillus bertholletiae TaxID=1226010 RepID=A0A5N7BHK9_9EURO|nr:Alpha/Beta hydrolase protein [Aspergillus bertholletiae]
MVDGLLILSRIGQISKELRLGTLPPSWAYMNGEKAFAIYPTFRPHIVTTSLALGVLAALFQSALSLDAGLYDIGSSELTGEILTNTGIKDHELLFAGKNSNLPNIWEILIESPNKLVIKSTKAFINCGYQAGSHCALSETSQTFEAVSIGNDRYELIESQSRNFLRVVDQELQLSTWDDSAYNEFYFTLTLIGCALVALFPSALGLGDGKYVIRSASMDRDLILTNTGIHGNALAFRPTRGASSKSQTWDFTHIGNSPNDFEIISTLGGDINCGSEEGTSCVTGDTHEIYTAEYVGGGRYELVAKSSGYFLTVDNRLLTLAGWDQSINQQFIITSTWAMKRLWRNYYPRATRSQTHLRRGNRPACSHYHALSNRNSPGKRICSITEYQSNHKTLLRNFQRPRSFVTTAIPSLLVPPLIFVGLLLTLWTWKCFWIVVLQDKLLYLSWLPPLARSEKIADYEAECRPVQWTEKQIRSLDGTKLAVCEGRIPVPSCSGNGRSTAATSDAPRNPPGPKRKAVVICYFQGNGGSTPLRLPLLSQVLRSIREKSTSTSAVAASALDGTEFTIVALSYRGYWTSSGRATQSGIELDAQAFLDWVSDTYAAPDTDLQVILWGHSLGSAIASNATATYLSRHDGDCASVGETGTPRSVGIAGLVMEAPSSSIKDMLISLYPQKWLPYRYLWPFSWNHWSCTTAMERIARWRDQSKERGSAVVQQSKSGSLILPESGQCTNLGPLRSPPPILLLSAQSDEVIPPHVADDLESDGKRLGLELERKDVRGALHTEASVKVDGREALVNFFIRRTSNTKVA